MKQWLKEGKNLIEQDDSLIPFITKFFDTAVDYLKDICGEDYPLPPRYEIFISKRRSHANFGAEMYLSEQRLKKAITGDKKFLDEEQSLFIHELVHNIRDEEDLPMLAELTYMIEKGYLERIQFLVEKYTTNRELPDP